MAQRGYFTHGADARKSTDQNAPGEEKSIARHLAHAPSMPDLDTDVLAAMRRKILDPELARDSLATPKRSTPARPCR